MAPYLREKAGRGRGDLSGLVAKLLKAATGAIVGLYANWYARPACFSVSCAIPLIIAHHTMLIHVDCLYVKGVPF